jgi:hypothetical protein
MDVEEETLGIMIDRIKIGKLEFIKDDKDDKNNE